MRFHILGMTHLPVAKQYSSCAYSTKVYRLCKMLLSKGHEVYLYGIEGSDAPCTEFIQVSTLNELREQYGDGDNRFELGYDWHTKFFRHNFDPPYNKQTLTFFDNTIKEINKRKKDDDFLLLTQGAQGKIISDGVKLFLTCESGVGYRGIFARFKAFESSFIQNYDYGYKNNGQSANGNNYDVVIPNYFNVEDFKFTKEKEDYLLYFGRLINRKGILTANEISKRTGKKLVVVGQGMKEWTGDKLVGEDFTITDCKDRVEYLGYADKDKRSEIMGKASCTIVATDYLEPFGGVSIESLLCGTPVITTNFGCFPETIPHGKVGYRCQTLDQFVWAAKNIKNIKPEDCREYAVKNFSLERVSEMYGEWFNSLYHLYLSTFKKGEGWYYINEDRDNLDWLNKY